MTEAALAACLCFSLKTAGTQIGFARVLTDGACYAVLLDVVIHPAHRGRGLGRWMLKQIVAHPQVTGRRVVLWTTDKVAFYQAAGFTPEADFHVLGLSPFWTERPDPIARK